MQKRTTNVLLSSITTIPSRIINLERSFIVFLKLPNRCTNDALWYYCEVAVTKSIGGDGSPLKYKRVPSADLKSSRQGRHHELMVGIPNDLVTLPIGSAIQIPLNEVGGLSVAKLRSAVMRATAKKGISIESSSDKKNFYIWKSKAK